MLEMIKKWGYVRKDILEKMLERICDKGYIREDMLEKIYKRGYVTIY